MSQRGAEVDAFISVSDYYAAEIRNKMTIRDDQMFTVHIGVDANDYLPKNIIEKEPAIGFLSRMCEENGLAVLVDAFILLKKDRSFDEVKLKITGGKTADDLLFIKDQKSKISKAGLENSVLWLEEFDGVERQKFFESVAVLSVPVLNGEAFGLYQLEAMASGVPMVQPALGAFPEVISASGGGLVYSPNNPESLAKALGSIILDKEKLTKLSLDGLAGVQQHFDIHSQAKKMIQVYERVIK
jgi:glycosyltransferase involved in cell wall biosynthesis